MKKLLKFVQENPSFGILVPATSCFLDFRQELFDIIKAEDVISIILKQIVSSSNTFELFSLLVIMIVLNKKKK